MTCHSEEGRNSLGMKKWSGQLTLSIHFCKRQLKSLWSVCFLPCAHWSSISKLTKDTRIKVKTDQIRLTSWTVCKCLKVSNERRAIKCKSVHLAKVQSVGGNDREMTKLYDYDNWSPEWMTITVSTRNHFCEASVPIWIYFKANDKFNIISVIVPSSWWVRCWWKY